MELEDDAMILGSRKERCSLTTKILIALLSVLFLCGLGLFLGIYFSPPAGQNSARMSREYSEVETQLGEDCSTVNRTTICDGEDAVAGTYDVSRDECASLCWLTPTCVAWTFNKGGACFAKKAGFGCFRTDEDWSWGTKKCGDPNLKTR